MHKRIVVRGRIVIRERLILLLPIEIDVLVHNLDPVAGHSDDPFYVKRVVQIWKPEDDQITTTRRMTPVIRHICDDSISGCERG